MKTDFINNMTHEFKTPLATISLAVDAMRNEKVIQDPQILHNEMIIEMTHPTAGKMQVPGMPIKFSKTPGQIYKAPPLLSEDALDITAKYSGMLPAEIQNLIDIGAVLKPKKHD
jgi:crotonobetainyl-CoA:carnitine CoA-transferase CaiB-like acyl-CoA transferase